MVQLSFTIDLEPEYLVTGLLIWCPQALSQVQTVVQKSVGMEASSGRMSWEAGAVSGTAVSCLPGSSLVHTLPDFPVQMLSTEGGSTDNPSDHRAGSNKITSFCQESLINIFFEALISTDSQKNVLKTALKHTVALC